MSLDSIIKLTPFLGERHLPGTMMTVWNEVACRRSTATNEPRRTRLMAMVLIGETARSSPCVLDATCTALLFQLQS